MANEKKKIVALTACPVGIAHTYMAAENLEKAGEKLGVEVKVETHGSIGVENDLTDAEIEEADGVIIASDTNLEKDRFHGKPLVNVGVQQGIHKPEELIQQILDGKADTYQGGADASESKSSKEKANENPIYRHLMNGVSYMVPFVVVGGLLIALALSLGGTPTADGIVVEEGTIWAALEGIGGTAMSLMVPILSGFIAYSIADRPGLVPGMVGGFIAMDGSFYGNEEASAGFLGGIITGFLAGYLALYLKKINVPKAIQSIMPIIIIPIASSVVVGGIFIFLIGAPIAGFFEMLTNWLAGMEGASQVVLAMILGAMIAIDMGGPFNKVAFLFGAGMIAEGNYGIMGPIAVAICIPPIGVGLASMVFKDKFAQGDRETGKASFTMGLFGITEGAIPFASQDPLRVIPSIVVGSMVGAVVASLGNVGNTVAHGGPIVAVLGAVQGVPMFFVAVVIGVAVTMLLLRFLKKDIETAEVATETGSVAVETDEVVKEATEEQQASSKVSINKLTDILTTDLIELELDGDSKDEIVDELIDTLYKNRKLTSFDSFKTAIVERESESTTAIGMNIAIPHGKSSAVKEPSVVFGRKKAGVDWDSLDGTDAKLIFMIAVPEENKSDAHLKILQMLSRNLMNEDFRKQLLEAETKEEAYGLLEKIS